MDLLIIAIMCVVNAQIAKKRGRKAGSFVALTIALMYGLVMLATMVVLGIKMPDILANSSIDTADFSAMFTLITETLGGTLTKATFAALAAGAVISFLIALNSKKGQGTQSKQTPPYFGGSVTGRQPGFDPNAQSGGYGYSRPVGPAPNAPNVYGYGYGQPVYTAPYEGEKRELTSPCMLRIIREAAAAGANEIYTFSLNGHPLCRLGNGMEADVPLWTADNTITARDAAGMSLKHPVHFTACAGGIVEIHAKAGQFLPEKIQQKN